MNRIILGDCMEGMKRTPDKYYDLACVDPPYGIGVDTKNNGKHSDRHEKTSKARINTYKKTNWDNNIPDDQYFDEIKRVSKRQIIWGANYFGLNGGMLYWHKNVTMPSYSTGELAWLSWMQKIDFVEITWHGMLQQDMKNKEIRIHPTQKPIALYDWIFKNYAEPGMKVLDTHGGSLSSVISAIRAGLTIDCYEIDKDYYEAGKKRVTDYFSQLNAFESQPQIEWINDTSQNRK